MRHRVRLYRLLAFGVFVALSLASLAVSYEASVYLAFGILVAWPTTLLAFTMVRLIRSYFPRESRARGRLTFVAAAVVLFVWSWASMYYITYWHGPCAMTPCMVEFSPVVQHDVVISLEDLDTDKFIVFEAFNLEETSSRLPVLPSSTLRRVVELPPKRVRGGPSGFFLRKVKVQGPNRLIRFRARNGELREIELCGYYCAEVSVTLEDLPRRSFYSADSSQKVTIPDHPEPVKITWTIPSSYRRRAGDILIWYYPTTSPLLIMLLKPFAGITDLGGFVWVLMGLAGTLIISPFVFPALKDAVKQGIASLFARKGKSGNT